MKDNIDTESESAWRSGIRGSIKLVVLGATGSTGLEIVLQALERGHSVTAFVRSPERLKPFRDRIIVKQGDLLNSAELERVIKGHDAVLSGFGPRLPISKADANLLQQFAVALTSAMLHAGVRRVVVESVAFLFRDSIVPPAYLFGRLFFPGSLSMHLRWSGFLGKADSTGPWCAHRDLQTSPTRGSIACERVSCLVSVSQSRARTWPISCSRQSRIMSQAARSSECAIDTTAS